MTDPELGPGEILIWEHGLHLEPGDVVSVYQGPGEYIDYVADEAMDVEPGAWIPSMALRKRAD